MWYLKELYGRVEYVVIRRIISVILVLLTGVNFLLFGQSISLATDDMTREDVNIKEWRVTLPDNSWSKKYNYLTESWEFYKSGHYDTLNSTLSVFIDYLEAEESRYASEQLSRSFGDIEIVEKIYEVNDRTCPAFEQYSQQYNKTVFKVFYPLNDQMCLQINILVQVGNTEGMNPDSEEVKSIIQSILDKNEYPQNVMNSVPEIFNMTADDLSFEGKLFEIEGFPVIVPDEWEVFPITYGKKYLGTYFIKNGLTTDDYALKPSITMYVNEEDAYTSYITGRKLYSDASALIVNICGTECYAFRYREEVKYKNEYWTYIKVYLPISDSKNVSFKISSESSEFEGLDILDDDVRQIIISLQRNIM